MPGELESLTGDNGRVTPSAVGGAFLTPLRLESRDRLFVGSGGVSGVVPLMDELRLLNGIGTLKFEGVGEVLRGGLDT